MNFNDPTQWPPPGPSQPPTPQATLVFVAKCSLAGRRFPLKPAPSVVTLGRDPSCEIVFDPERDRVVGRKHAQISLRPDGIYLTDLDSRNGTFLKGVAVRGTQRIAAGDMVSLGEDGPQLQVVVELGAAAQPSPLPEHTQVLRPKSRQAAPPPAPSAAAAPGWGAEANPAADPRAGGWPNPRAPEPQSPLGWPDPRMEPSSNGWRDPRTSGAEWGGAPAPQNAMPAWNAPSSPAQPGWGQAPAPAQPGWGQPAAPAQPGWGQAPAPAQPGWGQPAAPAQPGWGQAPAPAQPGWGQAPAPAQPGWGQAPAQPGWGQPAAPAPAPAAGWNAPSSPGAAGPGWGNAADGWGRAADAKGAPARGGFQELPSRGPVGWDEPGGGFDDTGAFKSLGGLGGTGPAGGLSAAGSGAAESLLRPAGAGPVVGGAAASMPGAPRANPSPLDKLAAFEPPKVSPPPPPMSTLEAAPPVGAVPLRSQEPSALPVGSMPTPTASPLGGASAAAPALKPRAARQEVAEEEEETPADTQKRAEAPKLFNWSPDRIAIAQQAVVIFVILLVFCGAGFAVAYMNPSPLFAQAIPSDAEEAPSE